MLLREFIFDFVVFLIDLGEECVDFGVKWVFLKVLMFLFFLYFDFRGGSFRLWVLNLLIFDLFFIFDVGWFFDFFFL